MAQLWEDQNCVCTTDNIAYCKHAKKQSVVAMKHADNHLNSAVYIIKFSKVLSWSYNLLSAPGSGLLLSLFSTPSAHLAWTRAQLLSVPWRISSRRCRWPIPMVCLFDVLTELLVAIYPVVPRCQSSGVRANWHSRSSKLGSPICSVVYSGPEACRPGEMKEQKANWVCLLLAPAWGIGVFDCSHSRVHGDVPLQTLQHRPSGNICSPRVQFSSGHVSVIFNIRPFWKDRMEALTVTNNDHSLYLLLWDYALPQLIYSWSFNSIIQPMT